MLKRAYISPFIIPLLCIAGIAINLSAYLPGFMSPDSFEQYRQSLTHQYNDWHPPAMALLWSLFNMLYEGPQLMLCFQLSILWLACFFLCSAISNRIWQSILFLLFGISPLLQNFAGYIIKDVQMAFSWLLAIAILFYFFAKAKRLTFTAATITLCLLVYGALLRPNALTGYIPLVILWSWFVFDTRSFRVKSAVVFSVIFCTYAIQKSLPVLLHAEKQYAENKLFLHDLSGIYKSTRTNVFPPVLFKGNVLDTAYLRAKYHPATFDDVWWNTDGKILLPDTNAATTAAIRDAWSSAIRQYPLVYMRNRYDGFLYYLRIKERSDFYCNYYTYMYPDPNEYRLTPRYENPFYKFYHAMFVAQKGMFYMKAWFWFVLNFLMLAILPVIKHKRLRHFYALLILSGVLYKLPDFFIYQSDVDYRYFYWNTIVCCLCLLLLVFNKALKLRD
ncbi:hypothetical protein CAP35_10715 [Chitinophagaceae bacterium IBVUCB1]|nr:hypothetical protein CAP35_10715 [Chitinophagaceae bacterium IBVUCB1]